ncbi:MAG: beta-lactamase family protein [Gemmatimonadota bacterium]|nr:beta-lactamase family protein [Gemmatimonadota bacterium]
MNRLHIRASIAVALVAQAATGRVLASQQRVPAAQTPAGWNAFTTMFDSVSAADAIVGASVLIMRDGRVLAHHEYGVADRARNQRVTERTLFHYGSITKTLTAIAIMQLRDRGKLSLDDKITRYVPELRRVHDPYGSIDSITLRMLLSHSAGFQDPTWPYGDGKPWEPFEPTTWEQLVAMMPYQELHFRPGSKFSYSNPGFIYLARVIEQLSGDPWETYIQKNIFAPLALDRSYFGATPYYLADDRADSYSIFRDSTGKQVTKDYGRDFDPGITIPNGGWNAPLADLATYMAFLGNATHGDSALRRRYDAVLSRASLEEMWRPIVPTTTAPSAVDSVGLSFFILREGGARLIGHTGSQAGFLAFVYLNPATSSAIVMAMNTNNQAHPPRAQGAYGKIYEATIGLLTGVDTAKR